MMPNPGDDKPAPMPAGPASADRPAGPSPDFIPISVTRQYSGPIPSPSTLAAYESVESGLASRIVQMAEVEAAHRREVELRLLSIETADVPAARSQFRHGQNCAVVVSLAAFTVMTVVSIQGHAALGGSFGFAALAVLVGLFLFQQSQTKKTASGGQNQPSPTEPQPPKLDSLLGAQRTD